MLVHKTLPSLMEWEQMLAGREWLLRKQVADKSLSLLLLNEILFSPHTALMTWWEDLLTKYCICWTNRSICCPSYKVCWPNAVFANLTRDFAHQMLCLLAKREHSLSRHCACWPNDSICWPAMTICRISKCIHWSNKNISSPYTVISEKKTRLLTKHCFY